MHFRASRSRIGQVFSTHCNWQVIARLRDSGTTKFTHRCAVAIICASPLSTSRITPRQLEEFDAFLQLLDKTGVRDV
jgi:hypothetical protein